MVIHQIQHDTFESQTDGQAVPAVRRPLAERTQTQAPLAAVGGNHAPLVRLVGS